MYTRSFLSFAFVVLLFCGSCKPGSLFSKKLPTDPAKCNAVLVRVMNTGPKPVYKYIIREGRHYTEFGGLQPGDSTAYQCMYAVERKFNMPVIILLNPSDTAKFEKDITDDFSNSSVNLINKGRVTVLVNVDYKKNGDKFSQTTVQVDTKLEE